MGTALDGANVNGHEWVTPYTERIMDFLGLQAWTWSLIHETGLSSYSGARESKSDATCDANWRYLAATITIDSGVWVDKMTQPSTGAKMLLCHEVLHIAFAQMAHGMETVINVYFPAEDETPSGKSTAMTVYSDHEEHVVTRLAKQVYEALEREEELIALRAEAVDLRRQVEGNAT